MTSVRALVAAAVVVAVVVAALALWGAAWVFLTLFGAVLLAVGLRGVADPIARSTALSPGVSVTAVVLVAIGLCAGAGALSADTLADQVGQLSEELPAKVRQLEETVRSWPLAQRFGLAEAASGAAEQGMSGGSASEGAPSGGASGTFDAGGAGGKSSVQDVASGLVTAVSTAVSVVGAMLLVIACGLYFAYEPRLYVDGFVGLVPPHGRERARLVLDEIGESLRWWLLGQLVAMTTVGTLMGLGLWALGVPMALALGVLSGVLDFVPNFGPVFALVPALLLSGKPVQVLVLWGVVQTLESYVITPLVQRRAVDMPPVVLIGTQVILSVLLGPAGLVTAAPLVVVAMVLVKRLYREDVLGDPVAPPSFARGAEAEG